MIAATLWWVSGGVTAASIAYLLLAFAAVAMHRQRSGPGWAIPPDVTILKPLCGHETGLEGALESFFTQRTTSSVRFIFGVTDPGDPALKQCREVAARFPECVVEFIVDPSIRGANPKVSNLINMAGNGLAEVVVISDSDIVIAPGTLQAAIDALAAEGVGAATTLYRARPAVANDPIRSFAAWYLDYWDLPMQMLYARLVPALAVTYGPLTAVRKEVLDGFGGLQALANHMCDDAELGRRVQSAGHVVVFTPAIAETLVNDCSIGQVFQHELRWARTVRGLDPLGYGASVVSHPGPIPLLLFLHPGAIVASFVVLPVLLRWLLARLVIRRFGKADGLAAPCFSEVWLRDCACWIIWATGFLVGRVLWRGRLLPLYGRDLIKSESSLSEQGA